MVKLFCKTYETIGNLKYPKTFQRENIEFALNYCPQNNDKFVVTYPKCGTTWTQQIICLIMNNGLQQECYKQLMWNSFIDYKGKDFAKDQVIKTHLPFQLLPNNKFAKYLIVLRNPKDTSVSLYHHIKSRPFQLEGDFHDFFKMWINGDIFYGDYFEYTFNYWSHRFDDNFSFLVYEHMKYNPRDAVLKIAQFLGEEYVSKLTDNNGFILDKVVQNSTVESMKCDLKSKDEFFVRKGIVGDWKSHFTKDESDLVDEKVKQWFSGTDLQNLWSEEMKW